MAAEAEAETEATGSRKSRNRKMSKIRWCRHLMALPHHRRDGSEAQKKRRR